MIRGRRSWPVANIAQAGRDRPESGRTAASPGWGRASCLIHCTGSWERGKAESYIHWELHTQASAGPMQWPELELSQDNGINFPSAGQNGPRDFYFYSFSITTARQRKQAPKQCEPPIESFSPVECHLSTTHLADLILPLTFTSRAWRLTSSPMIIGERHSKIA